MYEAAQGVGGTLVNHGNGGFNLILKYQMIKAAASDGSTAPVTKVKMSVAVDTTYAARSTIFTTKNFAYNQANRVYFGGMINAAGGTPSLLIPEIHYVGSADYKFGDVV